MNDKDIEEFFRSGRMVNGYTRWKKAVFKRDNYTCQMPGCKSKRQIQAHHIMKYASSHHLRTVVENGITLCRECHSQIYGKEEYFMLLFLEIVTNKKKS
jgi:5-methylcytosine-specific restriction endonuclease McrA